MFLELKNIDISYFDLEDFVVEVIRYDLLPFGLIGVFDRQKDVKNILGNIEVLKEWLSNKVLPLSR